MHTAQQLPGSDGNALWRVVEHSSSIAVPGPALRHIDCGGGCVGPPSSRQQLMPNLHIAALVSPATPCMTTTTPRPLWPGSTFQARPRHQALP